MHMERQEKVLPFGTPKHLSTLLRLYIYALHGYFIEVSFTAIWDFFLTTKSWKLAGKLDINTGKSGIQSANTTSSVYKNCKIILQDAPVCGLS